MNTPFSRFRKRFPSRPRILSHRFPVEPLEPRIVLAVFNVSGVIANGTVWANGDIQRITGDTTVPAGATLTIEPGAIIQFNAFAAIDLFIDGTVNANGTTGSGRVLFTSVRDDTGRDGLAGTADDIDTEGNGATTSIVGEWNQIAISATGTATFNNVEVRSGGDPFPGVTGSIAIDGGALTLTNSTVSKSEVVGVRIAGANPTLTNNIFRDNLGAAVSMDLASNPAISAVTSVNNGVNGLAVDGGTLSGSRVWDDPDIVYRLSGDLIVGAGATLTVAPGQIVKARAFAADDIIVNGTLNADGTAAQPIIFTTDRDDAAGGDTNNNGANVLQAGEWNGITFNNTSTANVLDRVEVRSAGDPFPDVTAAVIVNGAPLTMTNSVISDSEVHGVRIIGANPTLTNNTFAGNLGAAISMDLASNPAISGVTVTNNGANALVVDGGTLTGSRVWDDPDIVYRLNGDLTIATGATLTIAPGMVVKARAFGADDIIVDGTLNADGTASQPIIFTTDRDDAAGGDTNNNGANVLQAGEWNGITFNSTSTANLLDYVEIRSAGDPFPGITAAVIVNGAPLTMTNSIIRDSEVHGVRIVGANPTLTSNIFQGNLGAAVSMDLASNPAITGVTVTNNGINALVVDAGTLSGARVWDDTDIVYRLNGDLTIEAGASLTIAPGMVVKARAFGADDIIVNGTLNADGTLAQPIIFTTDRDDAAGGDTNNNGVNVLIAGEWNGLTFNNTSTANLLDYVEIRSAGDPFPGITAAVIVNGAPLTLTNSIIRDSEVHGVRIVGANPTLTSNTFAGNLGAAISMDLASNPAISGVTVTNNGANALVVDAGTLTGSRVWDDSDIVYRLNGDLTVAAGATLTIAPGIVVKARAFAADDIFVSGTLIADGTAAQPIIFTTDRDDIAGGDTNNNGPDVLIVGEWNGLRFDAGSTGNLLDHVEVRSAGDPFTDVFGAVVANGGAVTVTNSVISRSETHALTARSGGTLIASNNLIRDNLDSGIRADSGGQVTAFNNTIDGNFRGISVDGAGTTVTITNNLITNNTRSGVFVAAGGSVTVSFNDVFNPAATSGNYEGLPDQSELNGNLSSDPKYINRAVFNFGLLSGSGAIDAGISTGAPATDFLGNARFDDPGVANLGGGLQPFFDIGAFERQQGSDPVNLIIENASATPAQVSIGDLITLSWRVTNNEPLSVDGEWIDTVFASADNIWDINDVPVSQVPRTGGLAPGANYSREVTLNTPPSVEGALFFIIRSDSRQQIRESIETDNQAVVSVQLDVPDLVPGTPVSGQFTAAGQSHYYRILPPEFRTLQVALDSAATSGTTEIYVRRDAIPSRTQHEFSSVTPSQPDQQAVVPRTGDDAYYVLVYAAAIDASPSPFTLLASLPGFQVQEFLPRAGGNVGRVTLAIEGTELSPDSLVTLVSPTQTTLTPVDFHFQDAAHVFATFDLTGTAPGQYDLHVRSEQVLIDQNTTTGQIIQTSQVRGDVTVSDAFEVVAGNSGGLSTRLLIPSAARFPRLFPFHVEVANNGNTDLPAPVLLVASPNGTPLSASSNVSEQSGSQEQIVVLGEGGRTYLRPGERVLVPMYALATREPKSEIILEDLAAPGLALNLDALESYYRDSSSDAEWAQTWRNFKSIVGDTWGELHEAMRRAAAELPHGSGVSYVTGSDVILDLLARARLGQRDASGFLPVSSGRLVIDDPTTFNFANAVGPANFERATLVKQAMEMELDCGCSDASLASLDPASLFAAAPAADDGCDEYRNANDFTIGAADLWVRGTLLPYLRAKYGPDSAHFWELYLDEGPLQLTITGEDPIIVGNEKAKGFRNSVITERAVRQVIVDAKIELIKRIKSGAIKVTDLPASTEKEFDIQQLLGSDVLDSSQATATSKTNLARLISYDNIDEIPGNLAGGIGGSDLFGEDRRQIAGKIRAFRLVDSEGKTISIGLESDLDFTIKDTVDLCPGDLGTYLEQLGTRPLRRLEANGVAGDIGFTVKFKGNPRHEVIPASALPDSFDPQKENVQPPASDCTPLMPKTQTLLAAAEQPGNVPPQAPICDPDDIEKVTTVRSRDPNDIVGPAGFGPGHHLVKAEPLNYTIHFENDPRQASAPAQDVTVTNKLDPDMDWSTLELGAAGFGNIVIEVPPGLRSFATTVQTVNLDGTPLLVGVNASLNLAVGEISWAFRSLDPDTGLAPADPFAGFLPPNDSTHRGEGFVSYVIRPMESSDTGVRLDNSASIVFDVNEPILTNTVFNTIDADAPSSSVNALPATTNSLTVPLAWSGSDDAGGSGIATYDVFVSDNGGPFTLFLDDTILTASAFTGQDGHTYGFFTVATDNLGFVETSPVVPDTTTTVRTASLTIAASDAIASETKRNKPADPAVFTLTRTGDLSSPLTLPYTLTGTATSGTDYTALTGSAVFAAGSATATVQVDPLDDRTKEGGESLVLTLQPVAGLDITGSASATVTIADNDVATVTLSASDANAAETAARTKKDSGKFTFTRAGSSAKALVVDFTVAGTATDGVDFQELNGKVKFAPGSKKASVKITPNDDTILEGDETVAITLAPSSKYNIGTTSTAAVTIGDNETAAVAARTTLKQFGAGNYHSIGSGNIWDYNRNAFAGLSKDHRFDKVILDVAAVVAGNADPTRFERTPLFRDQPFSA